MRARTYLIVSLLVICSTALFRWPVLSSGFTVDDYAQLSMMTGQFPTRRAPLDLFTFVAGPADNQALRVAGYLPWWSNPALKVSLFRPLASALMWLDLRCFGDHEFAYHLHSGLWWLAMMCGLAAVYRRLLPPIAAAIALLLCAVHPAHSMFLGWVASRNAVISMAFCAWGLWAQLRRQEDGWAWGGRVAAGCYLIALAAGEDAMMFLPYAFARAAIHADGREQRRRRVVAWGLGAVAYLGLRAALGFGSRGSAMYVDPLREPGVVLESAVARVAVLAGDFVLGVRAGWWYDNLPWGWQISQLMHSPWLKLEHWRLVQLAFGVAALLVAGCVMWVAREPRLRFIRWALPCSLLPALCTFPEDRLLLPALFGWSILLVQAVFTARGTRRFVPLAALAAFVCVARPAYTFEEQRARPQMAAAIRRSIVAPELDGVLGAAQRVLLVSATDPTTTIYIPMIRRWYGRPGPAECQLLSSTTSPQLLYRIDRHSFMLTRLDADYTALDAYASVFNRGPLETRTYSAEPSFQATIEATESGRPQRTRFTLDLDLDDPRVVLLSQTENGLTPWQFPPVGQIVRLEAPQLPVKLVQ